MKPHTEAAFETVLFDSLVAGGYEVISRDGFDRERGGTWGQPAWRRIGRAGLVADFSAGFVSAAQVAAELVGTHGAVGAGGEERVAAMREGQGADGGAMGGDLCLLLEA